MKYGTEWSKLSKKILQERPNCELCAIRGIEKPAEQVHHCLKPDKQLEPDLENLLTYDRDNLVAVCAACHSHIHAQNWFLWPEQRKYLDDKKNAICTKYIALNKVVMWTEDINKKRKQRRF